MSSKKVINYAFNDKLTEMTDATNKVLVEKVLDRLGEEKISLAQQLLSVGKDVASRNKGVTAKLIDPEEHKKAGEQRKAEKIEKNKKLPEPTGGWAKDERSPYGIGGKIRD